MIKATSFLLGFSLFIVDYGVFIPLINYNNTWIMLTLLFTQIVILIWLFMLDAKYKQIVDKYGYGSKMESETVEHRESSKDLEKQILMLETQLKSRRIELETLNAWLQEHSEYRGGDQ